MINFNELINGFIKKDMESDKWGEGDTDNTYHASSVGYCPRQMALMKSQLIPPNRTLQGIFYIGKLFHKIIQDKGKGLGEVEVPIKFNIPDSKLELVGSVDFIDKENVYDFKTKSSLKYVGSNVSEQHKVQALIYMKATDKKRGSIIYIDKTNFNTTQIAFGYDEDIVQKVFEKIRKFHPIYMNWKNKGFPLNEIPFKKCGCYICRYDKTK